MTDKTHSFHLLVFFSSLRGDETFCGSLKVKLVILWWRQEKNETAVTDPRLARFIITLKSDTLCVTCYCVCCYWSWEALLFFVQLGQREDQFVTRLAFSDMNPKKQPIGDLLPSIAQWACLHFDCLWHQEKVYRDSQPGMSLKLISLEITASFRLCCRFASLTSDIW